MKNAAPLLVLFLGSGVTTGNSTDQLSDLPTIAESQQITYQSANGINSFADILEGKTTERQNLTSNLYLPAACKNGEKFLP